MHADLVEVQGLQKEYDRWVGYRERVSLPALAYGVCGTYTSAVLVTSAWRGTQAWIAVNLTADLQESFTWNTRQIYLWLTAEYQTEKNVLNQAVFWNWIIESKVPFVLVVFRHVPQPLLQSTS